MYVSRPPRALPELVLYGKPGCHLCAESKRLLHELLAARAAAGLPAPKLVERDISTNPEWLHAFSETIPVLEVSGCRLPLALRPRQLRAFLGEVLDGEGAPVAVAR